MRYIQKEQLNHIAKRFCEVHAFTISDKVNTDEVERLFVESAIWGMRALIKNTKAQIKELEGITLDGVYHSLAQQDIILGIEKFDDTYCFFECIDYKPQKPWYKKLFKWKR